jgi:site-specific recombinase XerD
MGNIGNIKVQKKKKEVFTEIEIEKLKQNCGTIRNKAIICFLKSTGCRVSEMTNMNIQDIDLVNLECTVLGKGNKQRTVYIDPVTGMFIKKYLNTRTDDNPALFVGLRKERLSPNGVRVMLKTTGKKAGVAHVHPHKFRRTELTELVNRGMPIEQVKTLAGHEKIDTTMGYVNVDAQNVKHNYRKFS